jgi:UDP-N-acetylmuramate--alanine ligase
MLTYGFADDADFRAVELDDRGRTWGFTVERPGGVEPLRVSIAMPGLHNVRNALAAVAVASEEQISDAAIHTGLEEFAGVDRRFEVTEGVHLGAKVVDVVDDYGHHPTEILAVIETARKVWPQRRLVMAYQPHRYSRTQDLYDEFVKVLSMVDRLVLLEVYAAGEAPIAGADAHALAQGIRERGRVNPVYASDPAEAFDILTETVSDDDVLLIQGAGNVSELSTRLQDANAG